MSISTTEIKDVRPLDAAGKGDLSFLDNPKYLPLFADTGATRLSRRAEIRKPGPDRHRGPRHA